MTPTCGNVFVEPSDTIQTIKKFDIVNSQEANYQVIKVAEDVTYCRVGDFILFTDYKTYQFEGKNIYIVKEDDIVAVKTNSEIKK